jgi:uncharacterized membrane protein YqiK
LEVANGRADRADKARGSLQAELTRAEGQAEADRQRADRAEALLRKIDEERSAFWRKGAVSRMAEVWRRR